ncbi:MAG: sterol desaturase family protein [Sphingobacteriales bacterium]|jgi:sterol desaturase/sphingolipid hydroxylase (fatty acid hydroxylase superfamily)/CDGSH-type Zn-finger protein|nr:sterol desaturase family protein [Sphingobacteriales bacterium]
MENILSGINTYNAYLVIGIIIFFSMLEIISGRLQNSSKNFNDWIQEAGGFMVLSLVIKPLTVVAVFALGNSLFSSYNNSLSQVSIWILLPVYLLVDDFLQYWYHRSGHEYDFLWKLHRSHHQAEEMGFFISYRNAGLYYVLMPNLWWMGILTFLGGGVAVAVGLVLKQLVIISSHSTVLWDKPLYKIKFLNLLLSVVERIIVTPAFHHAHHGKSKLDGISDPNGNYGNMFSIWDQLFNTAVFTRKYPASYGLQNDPKEHWTESYFYPMVKSKNDNSELSKIYDKGFTKTAEPVLVELKKGEPYLWCKCGRSKTQPFCDGSHHGTKHKPVLFEAKKDGVVRLCNCKLTKSSPFCDNSHLPLTNKN